MLPNRICVNKTKDNYNSRTGIINNLDTNIRGIKFRLACKHPQFRTSGSRSPKADQISSLHLVK